MDNPEGHDAPVQDNEDAKVELEHRGKQGEGDDSGSDGEEVPAELDDDSQVADGLLVIARISQGLLVGGQSPGQGDQGGCCCHTCNTPRHNDFDISATSEIYKKWIKGFLYKLYLNEWLSNAWFSVFYLQRITLFLLCLHLFCYHVIDLHFHSSWSTLYSMVWHESYQWIEKRNFYPQCQLLGVTVISGQVIGGFLFYMEWMEHQF